MGRCGRQFHEQSRAHGPEPRHPRNLQQDPRNTVDRCHGGNDHGDDPEQCAQNNERGRTDTEKNDQQRVKHEGRHGVVGGENRIEHATQTRDGMHHDSYEETAQYRQADRGGEIAERVGDVGPEPRRRRDDACQRARHLGRWDHGEAIDDPNSTK
jgi:hypothetical protein